MTCGAATAPPALQARQVPLGPLEPLEFRGAREWKAHVAMKALPELPARMAPPDSAAPPVLPVLPEPMAQLELKVPRAVPGVARSNIQPR